MQNDIWFELTGFYGYYEITKDGLVRSTIKRRGKTGRKPSCKQLKQIIGRGGYKTVPLRHGTSRQIPFLIHRLIALQFIPNPENKPCVNHKNSIRTDNRIENLEWCTYSENNKHAYSNGFQIKTFGESHNQAILTEKQVIEIRNKYSKKIYTMPMLSSEYKISKGAIQAILNRKSWKHI